MEKYYIAVCGNQNFGSVSPVIYAVFFCPFRTIPASFSSTVALYLCI